MGAKKQSGTKNAWTWADDIKPVVLKVVTDTTAFPDVADGVMYFTVPPELNGCDLVSVGAHVYTASDGGTAINISLYNVTQTADMLTTQLTIDNTEYDSKDATTAAVIDANNDDVATGDVLRIDVNQKGANATGFEFRMGFQLP